jgi:hypothetical protein
MHDWELRRRCVSEYAVFQFCIVLRYLLLLTLKVNYLTLIYQTYELLKH